MRSQGISIQMFFLSATLPQSYLITKPFKTLWTFHNKDFKQLTEKQLGHREKESHVFCVIRGHGSVYHTYLLLFCICKSMIIEKL